MGEESASYDQDNKDNYKSTQNLDKIFSFWMKDLALMNSYLKGRLGDDFANKFFEFLVNHHRKEIVRRNPKLKLEEFAEVYSSMMSNVHQAHYQMDSDSDSEITFFIFDCLPFKVMNTGKNTFVLSDDFPCKIWCQKFVPNMAKGYGFDGSMTKKAEGCYCRITEINDIQKE
ncbi:MAG: hypothetical protein ACW981_15565 [Candidatus Hodarchaeales archaeon]|jgi:hypothetical protein